jgi:hypothetical protein
MTAFPPSTSMTQISNVSETWAEPISMARQTPAQARRTLMDPSSEDNRRQECTPQSGVSRSYLDVVAHLQRLIGPFGGQFEA